MSGVEDGAVRVPGSCARRMDVKVAIIASDKIVMVGVLDFIDVGCWMSAPEDAQKRLTSKLSDRSGRRKRENTNQGHFGQCASLQRF